MRKHFNDDDTVLFNCVNITWILASILPNIIDCYLGLTPQNNRVLSNKSPRCTLRALANRNRPLCQKRRDQRSGRYTRECKRISIELGMNAIEHTNAIQLSTRMQKHFNFNEHVNVRTFQFQLSTRMHVIEHANAFHLARERISIEYANAKNSNWVLYFGKNMIYCSEFNQARYGWILQCQTNVDTVYPTSDKNCNPGTTR